MKVVETAKKNKEVTFKDIAPGGAFRLARDVQIQIKVKFDSSLVSTSCGVCLETGVLTYPRYADVVIPVTCEVHVLPEESSRTISIGHWASTEPRRRRKFT